MRLGEREESENVEDRRGLTPEGGMALGGGGLLILILALVFGLDPGKVQQVLNNAQQNAGGPQQAGPNPNRQIDPAEEKEAKFTKVVFGDTERVWTQVFEKNGKQYPKPTLVLYDDGQVQSACGMADNAVGPFYCPGDSKVYIDLSFYKDMQKKLQAPGDFARAYVVAHEVGHHIQKLLGYTRIVDQARQSGDALEAKHMGVRLELQADYFAGVWANIGQQSFDFLDEGDIDSALNAAFQIGDDRLQKEATGRVVPDSFTHGTSKQRMYWFTQGFKTGDVNGAKRIFDLPYNQL